MARTMPKAEQLPSEEAYRDTEELLDKTKGMDPENKSTYVAIFSAYQDGFDNGIRMEQSRQRAEKKDTA